MSRQACSRRLLLRTFVPVLLLLLVACGRRGPLRLPNLKILPPTGEESAR